MGFPRILTNKRTYIVAAVAAVAVAIGAAWALTRTTAASDGCARLLASIPADRNLPEDSSAIIKRADLEAAFGTTFRKYQENRIEAQGIQSNFVQSGGAFTVSVNEVKGQQAAATWERMTTTFDYPDAPDIGQQAKFKADLVVAVYKNGVFTSITLVCGAKPTDGAALRALGKLAAQRVA